MEINNNLQVQNLTIETLYKYYKSDKLLVNRRYQRKLVWTREPEPGKACRARAAAANTADNSIL